MKYDITTLFYWLAIPLSAIMLWVCSDVGLRIRRQGNAASGVLLFGAFAFCTHIFGFFNHALWAPERDFKMGLPYTEFGGWVSLLTMVAFCVGSCYGLAAHAKYDDRLAWVTLPRLFAGCGLFLAIGAYLKFT